MPSHGRRYPATRDRRPAQRRGPAACATANQRPRGDVRASCVSRRRTEPAGPSVTRSRPRSLWGAKTRFRLQIDSFREADLSFGTPHAAAIRLAGPLLIEQNHEWPLDRHPVLQSVDPAPEPVRRRDERVSRSSRYAATAPRPKTSADGSGARSCARWPASPPRSATPARHKVHLLGRIRPGVAVVVHRPLGRSTGTPPVRED